MQHYGFTSRPLAGAEIIIINEGNNYIGIASDDRRYRIALEDGEVALFTDEGDKIHLKRNRNIEITCGNKLKATVENEVDITTKVAKVVATTSCDITSPIVNINAATSCGITSPAVTINAATSCIVKSPSIILGEGANRSIVDERAIAIYNSHTHPSSGVPSPQMSVGNQTDNDNKSDVVKDLYGFCHYHR